MSLSSYKENHHVYYTIAWSILFNGERKWYLRPSCSKTPESAFNETRENILLSGREDFEMKLAGFRFE